MRADNPALLSNSLPAQRRWYTEVWQLGSSHFIGLSSLNEQANQRAGQSRVGCPV